MFDNISHLFVGIIFHLLVPGLVKTKMMKEVIPGNKDKKNQQLMEMFSVTTDDYVRTSLNTVGWCQRSDGCFTHWFTMVTVNLRTEYSIDTQFLNIYLSNSKIAWLHYPALIPPCMSVCLYSFQEVTMLWGLYSQFWYITFLNYLLQWL